MCGASPSSEKEIWAISEKEIWEISEKEIWAISEKELWAISSQIIRRIGAGRAPLTLAFGPTCSLPPSPKPKRKPYACGQVRAAHRPMSTTGIAPGVACAA